jgi:aminoglycoside 6'-N-acetyltransferase
MADWDLVASWLARPDIERWWGSRAAAEAEIRLALQSSSSICRVIELRGTPIGYGQAIDLAATGGELPEGLPPGTWDADLFIGAPEHRARGYGQKALRLLTDEVFTTTLALAIAVFAPVRNEPATRAYERAGFRWQRVIDDPIFGPSWLMLIERPGLRT